MKYLFFTLVFTGFLFSCGSGPKGTFSDQVVKDAPDYSSDDMWAALPWKKDFADETPGGLVDQQENAPADVFYVHPTTYFGEKEYTRWNAPLEDQEINKYIDEFVIKNQASAFNAAGKIYAPRYRQAHIDAYSHKDTVSAKRAFEQAYQDVKSAFSYYMSHYNEGRPFIIASHSQGTTHTKRLVAELIDGQRLEKQMVAAYLLGIPVDLDKFSSLKPCESADETSCLIGWRTWKNGAKPKLLEKEKGYNVLMTNPLSWKTTDEFIPATEHKGTVLFNFYDEPIAQAHSAQIHKSILWTNKPKFKGSILYTTKNYHRGDINLFYVDIRENAKNRVNTHVGKK